MGPVLAVRGGLRAGAQRGAPRQGGAAAGAGAGRNERTLEPGKPLLDRTAAYGLLVPALLLVFVGWSLANGG
ncbi:hypothetical protein [Dactylosporangium darangshiense]|uniref:hypothetical protein n=1 Tax=Dactylosporangium darangshiense TaxID=579108 RepID=UPI00362C89DD